jgi:hypothetical protein
MADAAFSAPVHLRLSNLIGFGSCLDLGTVVLGFLGSGRWPLALLESPGLDRDDGEDDHQSSGRDPCGPQMDQHCV